MKELENNPQNYTNTKVELSVKKKKEVQYVLQGTLKPQRGHCIWELNEETGEIKKAEFKRNTAILGASIPNEELVIKPDCIYIPALNAENAKKKYLKNKEQGFYYAKEPIMKLGDITF